jgi:diazepam-binding inhibitor (GABA receptor modulator, acyl-CoA-binding protein)
MSSVEPAPAIAAASDTITTTDVLFGRCVETVVKLKVPPTKDEKLNLYGLYKQATLGDVNISEPGFFEFEKRTKWHAWAANKTISSDDAKKQYVDSVNRLIARYGISE